MKLQLTIVFCIYLLPNFLVAQNAKIDELRNWLEGHKTEDTLVVRQLNRLAYEYFIIEPIKTFEYSQEAMRVAKKIMDTLGIAQSYNSEGIYHWVIGDNYSAMQSFLNASKYFDKVNDANGQANIHLNLGMIYDGQGLYEKSKKSTLTAMDIYKRIGDEEGVARACLNVGTVFANLEDYENSLKFMLLAQAMLRQEKGIMYADNCNNIGEVYLLLEKPELADAYFDSSWTVLKGSNEHRSIANYYKNKALIDVSYKKYGDALIKLKKTEKICLEAGLNILLTECYNKLADTYYRSGDFKNSGNYYKRYIELNDSLVSKENDKQINFLTTKFETEQKEKEISQQQLEISKKNIDLLRSEKDFQKLLYLLYGIFVLFILGGIITYFILQNKNVKRSRLLLHAQVNGLKNQLSPHFLLNSLSVISATINKTPSLADACFRELTNTYRIMLETFDEELVHIKTEIGLVESYINVMKYRFKDSFKVIIDLEAENFFLPPLALQLTIENAIKHNVHTSKIPLKITIFGEQNYLVVKNPYQPKTGEKTSTKIGFHNLIKRYEMLKSKLLPEVVLTPNEYIVKLPVFKTFS